MADIIRTVCAHDCPDMCSILVQVEDGRVTRVQGDPDQPFTAGFVCGKVARERTSFTLQIDLLNRYDAPAQRARRNFPQ